MRRLCLALGVLVLALVWLGPLLGAYRESFAAHMLAHMGVVAIAAPLLATGMGTLLKPPPHGPFKPPPSLPVGKERRPRSRRFSGLVSSLPQGGGEVVRAEPETVRGSSLGFSLPVLASVVELVVVWFWHAPSMRALAEASTAATVAEQASFLAAGLFLWTTCLVYGRQAGRGGAGAFGLLLTSVHMTLLGALLSLAPRPLYSSGEVACFGVTLTAAQDQQIGGVTMLLIGAAVYLAGGVALLARLLNAAPTGVSPRGSPAP